VLVGCDELCWRSRSFIIHRYISWHWSRVDSYYKDQILARNLSAVKDLYKLLANAAKEKCHSGVG
jgi:hypothetical protein